jgi:hypothetical protein
LVFRLQILKEIESIDFVKKTSTKRFSILPNKDGDKLHHVLFSKEGIKPFLSCIKNLTNKNLTLGDVFSGIDVQNLSHFSSNGFQINFSFNKTLQEVTKLDQNNQSMEFEEEKDKIKGIFLLL